MNERLPVVAISWFLPLLGDVLFVACYKIAQQIIDIFTNVVWLFDFRKKKPLVLVLKMFCNQRTINFNYLKKKSKINRSKLFLKL
jgi:hypothetical protein